MTAIIFLVLGLVLMAASGWVIIDCIGRVPAYAAERDKLDSRQLLFTGLLIVAALMVGGAAENLM